MQWMGFNLIQHLGTSAFLISKPLQLMIALCIVKQYRWESKPVFIILDSFNGAKEATEKLTHVFESLQSPIFFPLRQNAFSFIRKKKFEHLFIDSDVGVKNYITLGFQKIFNPRMLIHVFEEGLGTYRNDFYHGLKKKTMNLIGVATSFGTCRFVTDIYVFNTHEYISKIPSNELKVRSINSKFSTFLAENRGAFNKLFGFNEELLKRKQDANCSIYLSNWKIDEKFISYFKNINGDLYIKPHPHIRDLTRFDGIGLIGAKVPAELVIAKLMEVYDRVSVFDHYSSVRQYVAGDNLTFRAVSE